MSRPRIRTIKPDAWADEKLGTLSRDARLCFLVLVTLADDQGRLRDLPAAIVGHGYPYDTDASVSIHEWLMELETVGLTHRYVVDGCGYLLLPGFARHQYINRPSPSELPAPPGVSPLPQPPDGTLREGSVTDHGNGREGSVLDRKGKEGRTYPQPFPEQVREREQAPAGIGSRADGTNPKALGTNPRALGTNARALGTNPRKLRAAGELVSARARAEAAVGELAPASSEQHRQWTRLRAAVRAAVPDHTWDLWVAQLELAAAAGEVLVLDAPDAARPMLKQPQFGRLVEACARSTAVRARIATGLEHEGFAIAAELGVPA